MINHKIFNNHSNIFFCCLIIIIILTSFYQIIFFNKTLTTALITAGVMGEKPSENYIPVNYQNAGNIIDRGGTAWQDEPLTIKVANLYHKFQLPLWNKSQGFGKPLGADMMSASFSIFRIPLYVFPKIAVFDLVTILRIITAALGMFLFLKNQKFSNYSSLFAAILFSLSGYFIYYINMGHIQVEVLMPWLFLALDNHLKKRSYKSILILSLVLGLIFMGGHPESMVIIIVFASFYYFFRLQVKNTKNKKIFLSIFNTIKLFIFTIFLSILLFSFFLIPFFEYFLYSDIGARDSSYAVFAQSLSSSTFLLNFFPFLIRYSVKNTVQNHFSVIALFFIIMALKSKKHKKLLIFSLSCLLILICKIYGVLPFNFIKYIPIFNNFVYYKYLQVEISFFISILSAIGFQYAFEHFKDQKIIKFKYYFLEYLISGLLFLLTIVLNRNYLQDLSQRRIIASFLLPISFILIAQIIFNLLVKFKIINNNRLFFVLIILLFVLEINAYIPKNQVSRINPYYQQDFIKFLKKQQKDEPFRTYSTQKILYPATAGVYDLEDIRDVHAVYPKYYMKYIKNFIDSTFIDRFSEEHENVLWRNNPYFNLTNTKYILSFDPLTLLTSTKTMQDIMRQNISNTNLKIINMVKDDESIPAIFAHAPTEIRFKVTPTQDNYLLSFIPLIDKNAFIQGTDGVKYQILIKEKNKDIILYSKIISPEGGVNWYQENLDLSSYLNQEIELIFQTNELSNNNYDWSAWGFVNLGDKNILNQETNKQFKLVYNKEIKIYENLDVIPRAFLVNQFIKANNENELITLMKQPNFNANSCAIYLDPDKKINIKSSTECNNNQSINNSKISFINISDTNTKLSVATDQEALLVLTDIYYPGWKAYVNGIEKPIIQTDLAFRGIEIYPGESIIEFKYQPKSYLFGTLISSITILIVILLIGKSKIQKRPSLS